MARSTDVVVTVGDASVIGTTWFDGIAKADGSFLSKSLSSVSIRSAVLFPVLLFCAESIEELCVTCG